MLQRRKAPKHGLREAPQIRSPGHLAWVRGHVCAVENADCQGKIEAAHVRIGTDGGTGVKPSDCYAIPLCFAHHTMQHSMGERSFEAAHNISMRKIADELWQKSPHRLKFNKDGV